jgi:predicted dehydrogenase
MVLGCGSIGRRLIKILCSVGAGELCAFDVSDDRRRTVRDEYGVEVVDCVEDGWRRLPQAVIIATSTEGHIPLARTAVERGCHVFVEKPLSHTLVGVDELVADVDRRQLVTMVACNMRFHPGPATVKRLLLQGAVGKVIAARLETGSYLPRWRSWQDYRESYSASRECGGAILDCIHEIDLALWFFGPAKMVAAAHVAAECLGLDTDGLAEILLRHDSGVLSSLHLNFVQRDYRRGCQIIGTEGTIYWRFDDRCVRVYGENGELKQTYAEPEGWTGDQMYLDEIQHFLSSVRTGSQTVNPIAGGAAALRLAVEARDGGTRIG